MIVYAISNNEFDMNTLMFRYCAEGSAPLVLSSYVHVGMVMNTECIDITKEFLRN